jgi:hypothetical protein
LNGVGLSRSFVGGALAVYVVLAVVSMPSCSSTVEPEQADPSLNRVEGCGLPGSIGNDFGVGRFCERDSDCTSLASPLQLHCSTVLVDAVLPLLCSASCEPGTTDCGSGASCRDISSIGYDLIVCVPDACERDFPSIFLASPDTGSLDSDNEDGSDSELDEGSG